MLHNRFFKRCLIGFTLLFTTASHAGLITDIVSETVSYRITTGGFAWNASYDIGFVNQDLLIDVDVFLTGVDPGSTLRDTWESSIESIWSNAFDLFDGTFYYDTVFNVDWIDSYSEADHFVNVNAGNGNVNLRQWYTGNPSGWGYRNQGIIAAHEFGHMIGLFDEYTGGALDPVTSLIRNNSIMGARLSTPQIDHFDAFLEWAQINAAVPSLTLVNDQGSQFYDLQVNVPAPNTLLLFFIGALGLSARKHINVEK
ncbi:PEP-CTERM sorting domain-containing protein [Alteromonas sp. 1_MG-2023]|uniref:PEP-CTERM sorting domain-containing protein n=1 Tax=Alteromonas sp. 1_MG-2023 TaxID=3062669 RepID=UPI0026E15A27|nr:PEP-CTERM sorting domain-containing protein [Alteromonas sp. 1_MG-2023]MDO6569179.1 PEP-CTERM sorting domain-containing protein [Alteromonas sp. 1_MG-2023]